MNSVFFEKDSAGINGVLRPVAAHSTGRYDKWAYAYPKPGTIAPGFLYTHETNPPYLPPNWSSYVHPEGQLYFSRDAPLRVTTEVYMYFPELLIKVLYWVTRIETIIEERKMSLSENVELFVMLEDDDCAYYLVDHATRTQFWLEEVQTEELGIPDYDSPSHLKLYLEGLYWTHMEHFPMHLGGLPVHLIDELTWVFSHAMTDRMTSKTSTFFYSQNDCKNFIKILKLARENHTDGHQTCVVARLWGLVCEHRFQIHYGQEVSRLSRDQYIIYDPSRPSRVSRTAAVLTFGASNRCLDKLNDLFVDHLVYENEWQSFITNCLRDWRQTSFTAFSTFLLHVFFMYWDSCRPLAVASAALVIVSIFSSTLLLYRYDRLDNATASEAFEHLEAIHSEKHHFQFVALLFSLPKAFHLWSIFVLLANLFVMVALHSGRYYGIGAAISASLLLLWCQRLTSESTRFSFDSTWFRREMDQKVDSMV